MSEKSTVFYCLISFSIQVYICGKSLLSMDDVKVVRSEVVLFRMENLDFSSLESFLVFACI